MHPSVFDRKPPIDNEAAALGHALLGLLMVQQGVLPRLQTMLEAETGETVD